MKISPINNQQYKISHKAVNQKLLKQAIDNYNRYKPYQNQGHLLTCIDIRMAYKFLSYQDAIDTLDAIKPYSDDAIEVIESMIEDMKKVIFNQ